MAESAWKPDYARSGAALSMLYSHQRQAYDSIVDWLTRDFPGILVVVGAPGVGKTTVVRRALRFSGEMLSTYRQNVRGAESRVSILDAEAHENIDEECARLLARNPLHRIIITARSIPSLSLTVRIVRIEADVRAIAAEIIAGKLRRPPTADEVDSLLTGFGCVPHALAGASAAMRRDGLTAAEIVARSGPFRRPTILTPSGQPVDSGDFTLHPHVKSITEVSDALLRECRDRPEFLYAISARRFEEVVAELFVRQGYQVELTRASRDGGKDLYVMRRDVLGTTICLVECKRYRPDRPVGVRVVRELLGVVDQERATRGMIATTSRFTRDAKDFQMSVKHRMTIRDYLDVRSWIESVLPSPPTV